MIEIWRDDAPGERRAALVENGNIVELHIQRDLNFVLGAVGSGRIERRTFSGSFIICDNGAELLVRNKATQPVGARVDFEVVREAIAEPGRTKPAEARILDAPATGNDADRLWAGRLQTLGDWPHRQADLSPAFDMAIAGGSAVGETVISFQRSKAGLVFDIDGTGDPFASNIAAAQEIARLLRLYQVGGMALIDFIAVDSKAQRQEIAAAFDAASAQDRPFERSAVNGFGLMQVVRSRPRPSVLDLLFGTRIATLSDESQALWLLHQVARSTGHGPRIVTARTGVAALLGSPRWQAFREQAERQAGAAMEVIADAAAPGYGHVHVAQS